MHWGSPKRDIFDSRERRSRLVAEKKEAGEFFTKTLRGGTKEGPHVITLTEYRNRLFTLQATELVSGYLNNGFNVGTDVVNWQSKVPDFREQLCLSGQIAEHQL